MPPINQSICHCTCLQWAVSIQVELIKHAILNDCHSCHGHLHKGAGRQVNKRAKTHLHATFKKMRNENTMGAGKAGSGCGDLPDSSVQLTVPANIA